MEPTTNNFGPRIAKQGVRHGLLAALYIIAVAVFMSYAPAFFGKDQPGLVGVVFMLLLFVVSALVTGSLVLWSPAKLLVQGKTNEAGGLLCTTGATLVLTLVITAVVVLIVK